MKSSRRFRAAAFTIAEVMVAIGLFGITASAAVAGLLRMNTNAALCRLQTGASTIAQNQIDLILSDAPFNPQYNQIPPELAITPAAGTSSSVAVYTDPVTNVQVMGTMTTWIYDTNSSLNTSNLYIYKAIVTVSYIYKGRTYSVTMNTARCSDT